MVVISRKLSFVSAASVFLAFLLVNTVSAGTSGAEVPPVELPPLRIYATNPADTWAQSGLMSFDGFMQKLSGADVVFLGEQHGNPATHMLQYAVLANLYDRFGGECEDGAGIILSMEQFERDVQGSLNKYLAGETTEDEFLEASRPWGNYDPDYRRMVEFARVRGIPVVAANIPRPLASRIAHDGFEAAWTGYTDEERLFVATSTTAPEDLYWTLFSGLMGGGGHGQGMGGGMDPETVKRFYQAQCIKDDTMAESIVNARTGLYSTTAKWSEADGPVVVHTNGTFHSDYRLGTVSRVQERRPDDRIIVVAIRAMDSFTILDPYAESMAGSDEGGSNIHLADYVVFVPSPEYNSVRHLEETVDEDPENEKPADA